MIVHLDVNEVADAISAYLEKKIGLQTKVESVRVNPSGELEAVIKTGRERKSPAPSGLQPPLPGDDHGGRP